MSDGGGKAEMAAECIVRGEQLSRKGEKMAKKFNLLNCKFTLGEANV